MNEELKSYIRKNDVLGIVFDLWFTLIKPKERTKKSRAREKKISNVTNVSLNDVLKIFPTFMTIRFKDDERFVETLLKSLDILEDDPDPEARDLYERAKNSLCGYYASDILNCEVYPDTMDTLEKLRKRGFRLGVLSNVHSPYKRPFYNLGLDGCFDETCFSDEVGIVKPNPEIYYLAIQKLGLYPQEVLIVGDDFGLDVRIPHDHQLKSVLVDREDNYKDFPYRIRTLTELTDLLLEEKKE